MEKYLDFQLLLYVPAESYIVCTEFYERVFQVKSVYGWDEGEDDRGRKYAIAGCKLVVLAQETPFSQCGSACFQVEVDDVLSVYSRVQISDPSAITQCLFKTPYGSQVFRMTDPVGNHFNFYSSDK